MKILAYPIKAGALTCLAIILAACETVSGTTVPHGTIVESQGSPFGLTLPMANEDLLYASEMSGTIYMYSYAHHKLVGKIQPFGDSPQGLCSDSDGNVFVTSRDTAGGGTIYEFAHGGKAPIATLSDPGEPSGCAVDATTGNLAVVNSSDASNPSDSGDVAIYENASGTPTMFHDPNMAYMYFCTYDGAGNLFVDSRQGTPVLTELPKGSVNFTDIAVDRLPTEGSSVQWDGQYIALDFLMGAKRLDVYRIQVSGSAGTVVGTTSLRSQTRIVGQTWLQGNTIVGPIHNARQIGYWSYPAGGSIYARTKEIRGSFWGVTISRVRR